MVHSCSRNKRRRQRPKAPMGLAWEALKRGDPFRYRLKRLLIASKYGDLRLALTRVVQCAGFKNTALAVQARESVSEAAVRTKFSGHRSFDIASGKALGAPWVK